MKVEERVTYPQAHPLSGISAWKTSGRERHHEVVVRVCCCLGGVWCNKGIANLYHGDRAYRQVNSLYRALYNFNLHGRG